MGVVQCNVVIAGISCAVDGVDNDVVDMVVTGQAVGPTSELSLMPMLWLWKVMLVGAVGL